MKSEFFFIFLSIIILNNIKSETNDSNFDIIIDEEKIKSNNENQTVDIDGTIFNIKTVKEFDLNIKINGTSKNTLIILFYSNNCGHCVKFHPVYKRISEALKNNTNLKFSKIEFTLYTEVLKKYTQINVPYLPTIYTYKNGNFIKYTELNREENNVISFINKIHNFKCNEILSFSEINKFINYNTIFSLDKEKHFILGIFKNDLSKNNEKSFVVNNFLELNTLNNEMLLNKNCYYYFLDKNEKNNESNETNFYLNNILYNENNNEENLNLIYSYNYQRGLNTFSLFNSYLNFQNNSTSLNDYNNLNKHIKIIQNKYKYFLINNYLYKYYYAEGGDKLDRFANYNKNYFLFKYKTESTLKLFKNEIKYILSLNNSLNNDYLFILVNITNNKLESERIAFYNQHDFIPTDLLKESELNKTNIEYKVFEYIYRDQHNLIMSQLEMSGKIVKSAYNWLLNLIKDDKNDTKDNNENIENEIKISEIDIEQELIEEINKTIIEDENSKKKENNENNKDIEISIRKQRRRINLELNEEDELGFNKKLILFPFYLILYSVLYYFFYKYILMKFENKILYQRLPIEDPKNK